MLDVHKDALDQVDEAYHTFLLRYRKASPIVYGIVEGREDPLFYRSIIERFLPESWSVDLIRGGNKSKVLATYASFDWSKYAPERVTFFVDRDLQEFVEGKTPDALNIYVTDHYSIENDLVKPESFQRFMSEVCNLVDLDIDEEASIRRIFLEQAEFFEKSMSPIMAQIVGWRRASQVANLDNIDLSEIFCFHGARLELAKGFAASEVRIDYAAKCLNLPSFKGDERMHLENEFEAANGPQRFTRGKYLLWFFYKSTQALHSNIASISRVYAKPPKQKISVGMKNIMVVLAPRARCPASLKNFLERTYLSFIENFAPDSA